MSILPVHSWIVATPRVRSVTSLTQPPKVGFLRTNWPIVGNCCEDKERSKKLDAVARERSCNHALIQFDWIRFWTCFTRGIKLLSPTFPCDSRVLLL